ncbi:hypothetical protein L3X38_004138 [Prunus dulcis]|uniref:Uncharacterized protein n=1 Tax=Prunus dulcis TaxID=3755 RepID=A0AAD4ZNB3_PRUDU|nr:hypothetical protein L3X38_004138 [Prunus dulcis]
MKKKLEHNSSLVHYWTLKCVGAEQKLAYLTRQVNKARYRKEKQRIHAQRRKHKVEDLHMTEEDATYESLSIHKGGDNQGQAMSMAFNEGYENPKAPEDIRDIHQPKIDPKLRVTPNYCKHGAIHDHHCGMCRDLFACKPPNLELCQDCYNDKLFLDWEERGRFESIDDSEAEN